MMCTVLKDVKEAGHCRAHALLIASCGHLEKPQCGDEGQTSGLPLRGPGGYFGGIIEKFCIWIVVRDPMYTSAKASHAVRLKGIM